MDKDQLETEFEKENMKMGMHVVTAGFPQADMPSYMGNLSNREATVLAIARVVSQGEKYSNAATDSDLASGADGSDLMYGFMLERFAREIGNYSVARKARGRQEMTIIGKSVRTNAPSETKPRSFWEKLTGRGKDREAVQGGD